MFAIGHLALGYLSGLATSKTLKTTLNVPLILVLSVIPDIDILINIFIPQVEHRGPLHSVVAATILFIPLFITYKKKAIPYFVALIQHSLIGDYIPGGKIQLLWPISMEYFGREVGIRTPMNMTAEWVLFLISILVLFKTRQMATFFKPHRSNLLLLIPISTVLLPTFASFPLEVPVWLIPPHLAYTFLFLSSVIIDLFSPKNQKDTKKKKSNNAKS